MLRDFFWIFLDTRQIIINMKKSQLREYIRKHINEVRLKSGDKHYRFSPEFAKILKTTTIKLEGWNYVNKITNVDPYTDDFSFENLVDINDPNIYAVALYIVYYTGNKPDYDTLDADKVLKSLYLGDDDDDEIRDKDGFLIDITNNELFKKMIELRWLV